MGLEHRLLVRQALLPIRVRSLIFIGCHGPSVAVHGPNSCITRGQAAGRAHHSFVRLGLGKGDGLAGGGIHNQLEPTADFAQSHLPRASTRERIIRP
jgi:hypothetical protein